MKPPVLNAYTPGRHFIGPLPASCDVIAAVEAFCAGHDIQTAAFSLTGSFSRLTVGAYDPTQQVFVTDTSDTPWQIAGCSGTVSTADGKPAVCAHVAAADAMGNTTGGRLFSPARIVGGEIDLQEWLGPPLVRRYDPDTGLWLWPDL